MMSSVKSDDTDFGRTRYEDGFNYFQSYEAERSRAIGSVTQVTLNKAINALTRAVRDKHSIFACGNGGSTAIANHMTCDFLKGVRTGTGLRPRFQSLSSNVETIMAVANDISFDEVFSYQLESLGTEKDVLIVISSSGNSPNILRALEAARAIGITTIALTGFEGGRASDLADINLHIESNNYGIVEDCHHSLMHVLAQFLRQSDMDEAEIAASKF